jgi:hypothetical protein
MTFFESRHCDYCLGKAAEALGLIVPDKVLVLADEAIE